ncbi:YggS family pyridoxal phosphate-dependent enzyme [candidate division KSB1 bacterium]|nr:MAG: YggS family pyridoxal phosphate-dependent enzyme [candidate division KSB1 bacterium]
MNIENNIKELRKRVKESALRVNRNPDEINIVAVSKTFPVDYIKEAVRCGITDIGENRVQEAEKKIIELGNIARWHMVGHLQRNKVKKAVRLFDIIHSVDSLRLAEEINSRTEKIPFPILIEVNISGEESKFGIEPDKAIELAKSISKLKNLKVEGLMTVPPFGLPSEEIRPYFRNLRLLKEEIDRMGIFNEKLKYLSMGMTGDFEIAIEEGANIIRIGTAIFGERKKCMF